MKKIILLITTLFILSGCNVEYELNITNDNDYIENINIISENSNESSIINSYAKPIEAFDNSGNYSESLEEIPGVEYYDLSKSLNSNNLYNLNRYKKLRILKELPEDTSILSKFKISI